MDEMYEGGNGRERLFELFYDIKDELDLLSDFTIVKGGRNNNSLKPFQINPKKLKKSVKGMLAELKELVPTVKIDKEERESIKKLEAEIQEAIT